MFVGGELGVVVSFSDRFLLEDHVLGEGTIQHPNVMVIFLEAEQTKWAQNHQFEVGL